MIVEIVDQIMDADCHQRGQQADSQCAIIRQLSRQLKAFLAAIVPEKSGRSNQELEFLASAQRGFNALTEMRQALPGRGSNLADLAHRAAASDQQSDDK